MTDDQVGESPIPTAIWSIYKWRWPIVFRLLVVAWFAAITIYEVAISWGESWAWYALFVNSILIVPSLIIVIGLL